MEVKFCWNFLEPYPGLRLDDFRDVSHSKSLGTRLIGAWASTAVEEVDGTTDTKNNTSMSNTDADLIRERLLSKYVTLLNPAAFWRQAIPLGHFYVGLFYSNEVCLNQL